MMLKSMVKFLMNTYDVILKSPQGKVISTLFAIYANNLDNTIKYLQYNVCK